MLRISAALAFLTVSVLCGCDAPQDDSPTLGFTVASGVTIPAAEDLKGRIDAALRQPDGSKGYVMQSNAWVTTRVPPVAKRANATVRSYSASEGAAFVEVVLPEHKTWVLQVWRFDGAKWSDAVGPAPTRPAS
jgi:hypothetical protein